MNAPVPVKLSSSIWLRSVPIQAELLKLKQIEITTKM